MITLRELFTEALCETKETWDDVVGRSITLDGPADQAINDRSNWDCRPFYDNTQYRADITLADITKDEWLDLKFDPGYGTSCPIQVMLWTKNHIHFNYEYDGADFIITKPRNPPDYHGETLKIELLRQWRDYHWQEAFAAEGPLAAQMHRNMAEAYHQAHLLLMPGEFKCNEVPEPLTKYRGLKYGEYPSESHK